MKKTLLAFGTGFLAAVLLIAIYAFQTESNADVVVMSQTSFALRISHGDGETRKLDIGFPGSTKTGIKNQTAFAKVLQEYVSQGYSVKTALNFEGVRREYILTKN